MKAKLLNSTNIEGILYQSNLELKLSGPNSKKPGTQYITGTIEIATNDAMTNIVPIHYTYETATTSNGKENSRFTTLKNIIDKKLGCYTDPEVKENAAKLRVTSAIGLNEFYSDRNGREELVSVKRNEGGFIHVVQSISENEKQRNTFEADMVIVGVTEKDAVEDDYGNVTAPAKAIISGRIFDFRKNMLPVEFSAIDPRAIDYFVGLDVSMKNPMFTKVRGQIISEQTTRLIHEESAFGDDSVREVQSSHKEYVITWASQEPYEFGLEETITFDDLKKASQDRENTLAALKTRRAEYLASKANAGNAIGTAKPAAPATDDSWDF